MSKNKKLKKQRRKLISYALTVIFLILVAFAPTIYRSLTVGKKLFALLDKYGYSYEVDNKSFLEYCSSCQYTKMVDFNKKSKECPLCNSNIKSFAIINYYFEKEFAIEDDDGEKEIIYEKGRAYQFELADAEKGYERMKMYFANKVTDGTFGSESVLYHNDNYVFILYEEPSIELKTIMDSVIGRF